MSLKQDTALKNVVFQAAEEKPRFSWAETLTGISFPKTEFRIIRSTGEEPFDPAKIAESIGEAITDLEISRNNNDIFNEKNRTLTARVTKEVVNNLDLIASDESPPKVRSHDLHLLIEKTLADNAAYEVAKSLIFNRAFNLPHVGEKSTIRVIRRNNQVAPWNQSKVEIAVRKAFLSLQRDSAPAAEVAEKVTARVKNSGQAFVHIEEVQDIVQEELMKAGHFKVAEHYILYRAQRAADRLLTEEKQEPVLEQESMIVVKKPTGESVFWDGTDLKARIKFALIDLDLAITEEEIEKNLRRSLFDEITEADLQRTIILNARTLIERDSDFAKFSGRILLTYIYEEVLDWDILRDGIGGLKEAHQRYFSQYLRRGIEIDRLDSRLLDYDIEKLAATLDPSADLGFDYLGIQTLYDRYLIVDKTGKTDRRLETPQIFWLRVAMGLFLEEDKKDREDRVIALYELYRTRRFCSSTPTLFNSGTPHSQLSSCYLYYVDDSIEGIMLRGIAENAFLSKWAGGLGGSWTAIRGTGSHIAGTNGESQGVIPFLKLHNDQLIAVNQGGKRRGSGCAYLETWHNDLYDFLELRRNTGDDRRRCHDMNTANWIPDLFMKRMEAREDWTFFRSNEVADLHELYGQAFEEKYVEYEKLAKEGKIFGKTVPALEVWKKMLQMLFETGHPWMTFKDACNVRSPQDHAGVIHSSNLCTEITLNTGKDETAVCNLGSIIIDNHLDENGEIDHAKLRKTVRIAVRALDNVIDINFYPTEAAKTSNMRHRPIGLGVMGLQNALYKRGISFASDAAVEFNDEMMEAIAYYAYE
ncbi:MAG TPA: ribonucleoside-diphosphate reductase subunit alpha, partial [Opitutales bacterium]|nr:ribonucleoside-diphosphate reductase subunit alpha [Opitutales bacterium]